MTKLRAVAHLGIGGIGWTEPALAQPARFLLPAFSSTHSENCGVRKAVGPPNGHNLYVRDDRMAIKRSSIRLDTGLADEAAKILGAKSRSEAVDVALREIVALKRFKKLMKKQAGKLSFDGYTD
jgi:Arc/MetJ family transcription regulator